MNKTKPNGKYGISLSRQPKKEGQNRQPQQKSCKQKWKNTITVINTVSYYVNNTSQKETN